MYTGTRQHVPSPTNAKKPTWSIKQLWNMKIKPNITSG